MKLKRFLAVALTLCMMLGATQLPVSAQQKFTIETDLSFSTYAEPSFSYSGQFVSADDEGYTTYYVSLPPNPTLAPSEYYANELNDYQKAMYRAFMDGLCSIDADDMTLKQKISVKYPVEIQANITTGAQYNSIISNVVNTDWANFEDRALYNAIQYDHTELFWVQGVGYRMHVEDENYQNGIVSFSIVAELIVDASGLYSSDAELVSAAKNMNSTVNTIIANTPKTSEYDSLVYFNKWLKENNTYNHPHLENDNYPLAHSCISAFVSNNVEAVGPVCQGYAYAFKYLCDKIGIDCVVVTGDLCQTYSDPGPHAWNAVELDGKWYGVDVTSNDSLSTDIYNFLVGSGTASSDSTYRTFATSHVIDDNHTYPTLSQTAYQYVNSCSHTYDNDCDPSCNKCGEIRAVTHSYDSDDDKICNLCGEERVPETPAASFRYEVIDGQVIISGFIGNETEVVIPSTIEGYPVTKIDYEVFYNNREITAVRIPDTVVSIGSRAFSLCSSLKTVVFGKELRSIGGNAFSECHVLENFDLPDSLEEIKQGAFINCRALTAVVIPDSVTSLGSSAFMHCFGLKTLVIGNGVTTIPSSLLYNCGELTSITFTNSVKTIDYSSVSSCALFTDVYFIGTKEDRNSIEIDPLWNDSILNAKWHYFDGACDTSCSDCSTVREARAHTYDDDKDVSCNVCGEERVVVIIIPGDVNGDGTVNNKDLGVLRRYLNDWDVEIDEEASDVNDDGTVNNKDLGLLRRFLNDWDVVLK